MAKNSGYKSDAFAGFAVEMGSVEALDASSEEGDGEDDEKKKDLEGSEEELPDEEAEEDDPDKEDSKNMKDEQKLQRSIRAAVRATELDLSKFEKSAQSSYKTYPATVRWRRRRFVFASLGESLAWNKHAAFCVCVCVVKGLLPPVEI